MLRQALWPTSRPGLVVLFGLICVSIGVIASTAPAMVAAKAPCAVVTKAMAAAALKVPASKLTQESEDGSSSVGNQECYYLDESVRNAFQPSMRLYYGPLTGPVNCKILKTHRYSGAPQANIGTCAFWDMGGAGPRVLTVLDEVKRIRFRLQLTGIASGPAGEARVLALAHKILSRS
jgi:hypothetical protein